MNTPLEMLQKVLDDLEVDLSNIKARIKSHDDELDMLEKEEADLQKAIATYTKFILRYDEVTAETPTLPETISAAEPSKTPDVPA